MCVFSPSPSLSSACSIDRWLHFLLRIDRNSLSLACVKHLCRVVLKCRHEERGKGSGLELASHEMTLFLEAWYFIVWIGGIVRNELSLWQI